MTGPVRLVRWRAGPGVQNLARKRGWPRGLAVPQLGVVAVMAQA
jgi:hypothetical protein